MGTEMHIYRDPEQERRLLTYRKVAGVLGVSDRTIWQLVKDGELAVVRFRGTVRIDRRDLEIFIQKSKQR